MKKVMAVSGMLVAVLLTVFLLVNDACSAERLTRIAENVYAYVGTKDASKDNGFGANAGIIIGKDGIVVVDTLISAKHAKRFMRDIRAISPKPIKYVVNTHYHLDHVMGNAEFARRGAVIIAQANCAKAMEKSIAQTLKNVAEYGLTSEDMKGTRPAFPVLTYGDRMTIDIGGERIELIHARHAHTDGDTLVYLPGKKLLFAGDILFTQYHPFLAEGNIAEWVTELEEMRSMNVEKIVPGHGPLSTKKDLDDMKAYILLFDKKAQELASESGDLEKIVAAMRAIMPERPENGRLIGANIQMKYLKKQ